MITEVTVQTAQGSLLNLPMLPDDQDLVIEAIEGLDPVKATLISSGFAQLDGKQYQSSRRDTRNITLKIGLLPDYVTTTVRDIRARLYAFFMPKSQINLKFSMINGRSYHILGVVESFETAMFTAEPVVDISVVCFDPDFYEPDAQVLMGRTTNTMNETLLRYEGSVETGVIFKIRPDRPLDAFTIYHRSPGGQLRQLEFVAPMASGADIMINTSAGQKQAIMRKDGVESSVLYAILPQSTWLELLPGDNYVRVYSEESDISYTIEYVHKHGGL